MHFGKRYGSNEEVIAEIEEYLEGLGKSFYRKGIYILDRHWSYCITLEGIYVDE